MPRSQEFPPRSGHSPEEEISPELLEVLRTHVFDIPPEQRGRKEYLQKMSGASFGAMETIIDRPQPEISVESFVLQPGTCKVMRGKNGAGKTTIFDAIMETRNASWDTQDDRGAVRYGQPVHARENLRIARLEQEEFIEKLKDSTAGEILEQTAEYYQSQLPIDWENPDLTEQNQLNEEARQRIEMLTEKIADFFQMRGFLDHAVGDLSGGERTKLALFMMLLSEPDILLLDEPTNHLDIQSVSKLMALFNEYSRAGISVLSISHVDWFLDAAGKDGVFEVVSGDKSRKVLSSGASYENFIKNRTLEKAERLRPIEWQADGRDFKKGQPAASAPETFTIPESPLQETHMPVIGGGDITAICGDNGTGKTKLLETIMDSPHPFLPHKEKGIQAAYLPQIWPEEISRGTVRDFFNWIKSENLEGVAASSFKEISSEAENIFIKKTNKMFFRGPDPEDDSWMSRPFSGFSGGEQRILWFVAASSFRNINMLLLDEPTNHMDRFMRDAVTEALKNFGGAVALVSHDKKLITNLYRADEARFHHFILKKKDGRTEINASRGNPEEYFSAIEEQAKKEAKRFKKQTA